MFTLLADAMFTATLNRRGHDIPEHPKAHGDHYIPKRREHVDWRGRTHDPYRDLW